MTEPSDDIHDIETFGESTYFELVRAQEGDDRGWIAGAPICELLKSHHIAHVGRMWASAPFEVIRAEASGTFVLVGLEGEGEVLIDGDWRQVKAGEICLQPAFAHTGIRVVNEGIWNFAWVRYEESREKSPVLSTNSPVIHQGSVHGLGFAIAGLHAEVERKQMDQAMLHHWVELVHGFVNRAARPYQEDDRLWRVWDAVENELAKSWGLAELAEIACSSPEHLRRLCQQQLGRSPMQHLTYLRMRRAVGLLMESKDKVEVVAQAVGYDNPFTFSNAFKRWTGKRPTDYRKGE